MKRRESDGSDVSGGGKRRHPPQPARKRLNSSFPAAADDIGFEDFALREAGIPLRWIKTVVAVFLVPVAWILGQTFFGVFGHATLHNRFWATEPFWFFSLGVILWLIAFFGLPRPVVVYVFGHELTHVVWVWMMGGRVSQFHFSSEGGQIVTDKSNFLIALAPYFFPIYSMLLIAIWGGVGIFHDTSELQWVFFAFLGATWGFHLTFTCWMIPKGQTDLAEHGILFSLVVIFIFNLALLSVLLVVASPDVSWVAFGQELLANAIDFSAFVVSVTRETIAYLSGSARQ